MDGGAPVNFQQREPSTELWLHVLELLVASPCSGDDESAMYHGSAWLHGVGDAV
jgi:hypothetical protein